VVNHCYQAKDLPQLKYLLSVDETFCQSLRDLDRDIFLAAKARGCPSCGGILDTSNYIRKTRGMSKGDELRYSLCCRNEGCRKRRTPKSLRFLGRKVYGAWVVILAVDFCEELGMKGQLAHQTLSRWKNFWKNQLSDGTEFIKLARGLVAPGAQITDRPGSLVAHFGFPALHSWIHVLKFFTQAVSV
jgi:hypothetical protein